MSYGRQSPGTKISDSSPLGGPSRELARRPEDGPEHVTDFSELYMRSFWSLRFEYVGAGRTPVDRLSPERRSWNMSRIRGRDTTPEREVRSILHCLGCRFRVHVSRLPGRPDVVLAKHRTVIVVHGCFWHRHAACKFAYVPKSNVDFWLKKFSENMERDRRTSVALKRLGWRVITVWECEVQSPTRLRSRRPQHGQIARAHA